MHVRGFAYRPPINEDGEIGQQAHYSTVTKSASQEGFIKKLGLKLEKVR